MEAKVSGEDGWLKLTLTMNSNPVANLELYKKEWLSSYAGRVYVIRVGLSVRSYFPSLTLPKLKGWNLSEGRKSTWNPTEPQLIHLKRARTNG